MRRLSLFVIILSLFCINTANATTRYQKGYYKKNGTYVNGHYKTNPDKHTYNNLNKPNTMNGWK